MRDLWYRGLHRFCCWLYFARISVVNPERLPVKGPALYLGLHRNGAVDGFIYHALLPKAVFMISTQLRKNVFSRIFFDGIAVTRTKDDGDRTLNSAALEECLRLLRSGGELFIFPEGTSSLGPRHLPFKNGAVKLLLDYLEEGRPIQIVPIGIQYECPWAFRSKVEVVIGETISIGARTREERNEASSASTSLSRFKEMKRRMQNALEEVGINVDSDEYQTTIQRWAYVSTLGTNRSYFKTLKSLEVALPEKILVEWKNLEPEIKHRTLLRHQGVPLFPMGSTLAYAVAFALSAPLVLAAMALNALPLLAAWWAGERFPDDRNVISLWRILIGAPLFLLWVVILTAAAICFSKLAWLAGYLLLTWIGLKLYYRVKKLAVALHNGLRHPRLRARVLSFHNMLTTTLEATSPLGAEVGAGSAGFQRAVSQGFQPADVSPEGTRRKRRMTSRLEIGDTADWKSALPRARGALNTYPMGAGGEEPTATTSGTDDHAGRDAGAPRNKLLPHEILFGIFLASTWIRLGVASGFGTGAAVLYSALIASNAALIFFCWRAETNLRWRFRLLFYPLALNILFSHLKFVIPQIHPQLMDTVLQQIDSGLIGTNLSLRLESLTHPVLTETLSFCYLLFFPYLAFSLISYLFGDLQLLKKFIAGLFSLYGLGLLGYTLVPAQGPYLAMAGQFHAPLTGWWFTGWNAQLVRFGSNGFDVFPSLHCAITVYLLLFDRQHRPGRFKLLLLPCAGLWVSTLYLRYHYFIDLPCGFALGSFSFWLANKHSTKDKHETYPHVFRPALHESRA